MSKRRPKSPQPTQQRPVRLSASASGPSPKNNKRTETLSPLGSRERTFSRARRTVKLNPASDVADELAVPRFLPGRPRLPTARPPAPRLPAYALHLLQGIRSRCERLPNSAPSSCSTGRPPHTCVQASKDATRRLKTPAPMVREHHKTTVYNLGGGYGIFHAPRHVTLPPYQDAL